MENFMSYATCNIADFLHPIYNTLCRKLRITPRLQRKQWEFIYIIYQLYRKKVLHAQAKGLGFGVGSEPLCSFFASLDLDAKLLPRMHLLRLPLVMAGQARHSMRIISTRFIKQKYWIVRCLIKQYVSKCAT